MSFYVALLRAVNVGGTGKLPMKDLRLMCEEAGFESVQTYIASGNVAFESGDDAARVKTVLEARLEGYAGQPVEVFIRTAREMKDLVEANPFSDQPGNRVAVHFLDRKPPAGLEKLASGVTNESFQPAAMEVFVHYPEGQGVSKLKLDLGVATVRNMNTVAKLAELAATR